MLLNAFMSKPERIKKIDIEAAIRSKNPRLLKFMPRFVLNYIRRILHEKEVNEFLVLHGDKSDHEFVEAVIKFFNIQIIVKGEENIQSTGGVIYASNHPLGGLDALCLMHVLAKHRRDFKFIVNDILMQFQHLEGIFVGVNKHGKNSADTVGGIDNLYASDRAVLIFPAGLVSRKQSGEIRDLEWKKSFITKAKKHQRNIIPVFIEGKNSKRFYRIANFRKRIGVKANIEMFYLMDEMFRQKDQTITITFGKQIPFTIFDKSHTDAEWAEKVKAHVYALGTNTTSMMIKTN